MFNNGDKYEVILTCSQKLISDSLSKGEFKQGRFEGRGVYIFADGAVQQGIFHKGQYVGPDTEQSTQNNQESLPNISTLLKEDEVIVVAGDEDSADTQTLAMNTCDAQIRFFCIYLYFYCNTSTLVDIHHMSI